MFLQKYSIKLPPCQGHKYVSELFMNESLLRERFIIWVFGKMLQLVLGQKRSELVVN